MIKTVLATLAISLLANAAKASDPLETVAHVDLSRYVGKWYEIARLPQSFENGCADVTAEYSLRDDGKVNVLNTCHKGGEVKQAKGKAYVKDTTTNAKLRVSFFWPFYGDYWILELGSNYEYAVVGAPNRKYFWILSRTKTLAPELIRKIQERFTKKGFTFDELIMTPQS